MQIHLNVLLAGCGIFLSCLFLHVALWRMRAPRNHAAALLLVFGGAGAPILCLLALWLPHFSHEDLFAIALLHASLSCAYIQFYPASQADSPSLKILVLVGHSMPAGMTADEIQTRFDPSELFAARMHDLLNAQLVHQDKGAISLTPKGKCFILPFLILRKILGLPVGRG